MIQNATVVIDVGKTVSKISLWTAQGDLIARESRANQRHFANNVAVLDVHGIEAFIVNALRMFSKQAEIGHIIPSAHGASFVALKDGALAFPPIDYESDVPMSVREAYEKERDDFQITGSPALALGLNAGIQLFWMMKDDPKCLDGTTLVPWPQYWAWFLSGVARSEVTSLGCHTDLWSPRERDFSRMSKRLGWASKFAPFSFAGQAIGSLRTELAVQTGLSARAKVYCGVHDSNAALIAARSFAEIEDAEATVLSTGTWFVAMRMLAETTEVPQLPQGRDCLINVDVWGKPVPSSRFMGGRELETLADSEALRVDVKADQSAMMSKVPELIRSNQMLLPSFMNGFGPYPNHRGQWRDRPENADARRACASLYTALVADTSLDLVGAKERVLLEGRFAAADVFSRALASLRPEDQIFVSSTQNDVSFGALRLLNPNLSPKGSLARVEPLCVDLSAYKRTWRTCAELVSMDAPR